jgi:hypothetical protein
MKKYGVCFRIDNTVAILLAPMTLESDDYGGQLVIEIDSVGQLITEFPEVFADGSDFRTTIPSTISTSDLVSSEVSGRPEADAASI